MRTLYEGFVDELNKLAKKKKREGPTRTLTEMGSLAVVGGLIGNLVGAMAKREAQGGYGDDWLQGDVRGISDAGGGYDSGRRPPWSHKARKWGKRAARIGAPMWLSGMLLEKIRRGS